MYDFEDSSYYSTLHWDEGLINWMRPKRVNVNVIKGHDYIERCGIHHVRFVKIDTEGHDLDVLRGFRQALHAQIIDVIQFEHNSCAIAARVFLKDFFDTLGSKYKMFRLLPKSLEAMKYNPAIESCRQANYVAISENFLADSGERILRLARGL